MNAPLRNFDAGQTTPAHQVPALLAAGFTLEQIAAHEALVTLAMADPDYEDRPGHILAIWGVEADEGASA